MTKDHKQWLENVVSDSSNKKVIVNFWVQLYQDFSQRNGNIDSVKSLTSQYKDEVISILNQNQSYNPCDDHLRDIQIQIENLTMQFDEESIYKTNSYLIKMLAENDEKEPSINAKDFLINELISDDDKRMIAMFGHYTLEALIVYVLSQLYTSDSNTLVRVASLVDQLERNVRSHGLLITRRGRKTNTHLHEKESDSKSKKMEKMFPIGTKLVEFMVKKEMISLSSEKSTSVKGKQKKGGFYYLESALYVICNFDLSLLPIKFNLPMVCKPLSWERARIGDDANDPPRFLSDLKGGYLTTHCGNLSRYNLISSNNINHYYINIEGNYKKMCDVMNKLQGQAFQINKKMLDVITDNYSKFIELGLLMPRFLSNIKMMDISPLLREHYMKDASIRKLSSFDNLLHQLQKDIQRARYENLIINMAEAYTGYKFYLPVFLDFRGRIYRSGLLHFHEGDLARSLIMFADDNVEREVDKMNVVLGAAFHYKSFKSYRESYDWLQKEGSKGIVKDLFKFSSKAKKPFQFISTILPIISKNPDLELLRNIPITQDASASAYQIMSYFLLDETMAYRTNLFSLSIDEKKDKIQDIYLYILEELKDFIRKDEKIDENLTNLIDEKLDRKIVKSIFMPMIYGKTLMSTAGDLREQLSQFITNKESFSLASSCFSFWKTKYNNMDCLIRLIQNIGWVVSKTEREVKYQVSYFQTVQDYMKMEPVNIWVYDCQNNKKKRRKVTLRVSSNDRDRRKTVTSTFVNFIHQRDAYLAMKVVESMLEYDAPIYTVHDNFISTSHACNYLPGIYNKVFSQMGPPLTIINEFLYSNIIEQAIMYHNNGEILSNSIEKDSPPKYFNLKIVISQEILKQCFNSIMPEGMKKMDQKVWDERVNTILNCYEKYTNLVCGKSGDTKCFDDHYKKYAQFKNKVLPEGIAREKSPNYSLHF